MLEGLWRGASPGFEGNEWKWACPALGSCPRIVLALCGWLPEAKGVVGDACSRLVGIRIDPRRGMRRRRPLESRVGDRPFQLPRGVAWNEMEPDRIALRIDRQAKAITVALVVLNPVEMGRGLFVLKGPVVIIPARLRGAAGQGDADQRPENDSPHFAQSSLCAL